MPPKKGKSLSRKDNVVEAPNVDHSAESDSSHNFVDKLIESTAEKLADLVYEHMCKTRVNHSSAARRKSSISAHISGKQVNMVVAPNQTVADLLSSLPAPSTLATTHATTHDKSESVKTDNFANELIDSTAVELAGLVLEQMLGTKANHSGVSGAFNNINPLMQKITNGTLQKNIVGAGIANPDYSRLTAGGVVFTD